MPSEHSLNTLSACTLAPPFFIFLFFIILFIFYFYFLFFIFFLYHMYHLSVFLPLYKCTPPPSPPPVPTPPQFLVL